MSEEEGKSRGIGSDPQHHHYGTFQGPPPSYPQPAIGFPQPIPPPGAVASAPPYHYHQGYQAVPGYAAVAEGRPVRERRLPCCGIGLGWFLFIIGFFLAAIPWYVGALIILCSRVDYREKPGFVACTIAFHQYQVVGRALPSATDEHPKIYRMKLWATNEVRAKSKFWYFLRKLKKVKKSNGQVLAINEIFERNPTTVENYGIWLRYQSRTGYHNMYKEYRDTTLNGAVEQMYDEMASRHRVRSPCIQIIKTATIPDTLCKRENTKQFHDSKIKFPLVFKKVRPPTRKLKTTFKASRPNLFM
ncbi:large ribosomal subunit protein eL20 isoform X2 [Magnolia sinica]|uniref:large ribosomal subunit protein eL20 isoform X2 n=1 Tax=Magnolia sinica TaxID=86752 RepID=UPI002659A439|nr:large ribosomal subunit protein eL20 isoform X2 [Magnolia sinica]